jgi:hypothetical protein
MSLCVGLDLGQSADFTALAVVEDTGDELHLRHLERYPLRTPYPEIADKVARLMRDDRLLRPAKSPTLEELRGKMSLADARDIYEQLDGKTRFQRPELVVDATGVGVAVTDLLKERGLRFRAVTITGGEWAHYQAGSYRVPKRDLVAALEVPFHNEKLQVAEGLELWPTLREELLNFRRKIDLRTAHDSYEHWRDSDHDDLVLACALACWWIRRSGRRPRPVGQAAPGPSREEREAFGLPSPGLPNF